MDRAMQKNRIYFFRISWRGWCVFKKRYSFNYLNGLVILINYILIYIISAKSLGTWFNKSCSNSFLCLISVVSFFKENSCKNTNIASKIHDFFKIFENTQIWVFLIFFLWVTSKIGLRETLTKVLDNFFQICFIPIWSKFQSASCINFHLKNVHTRNDQNAAKFWILLKQIPPKMSKKQDFWNLSSQHLFRVG